MANDFDPKRIRKIKTGGELYRLRSELDAFYLGKDNIPEPGESSGVVDWDSWYDQKEEFYNRKMNELLPERKAEYELILNIIREQQAKIVGDVVYNDSKSREFARINLPVTSKLESYTGGFMPRQERVYFWETVFLLALGIVVLSLGYFSFLGVIAYYFTAAVSGIICLIVDVVFVVLFKVIMEQVVLRVKVPKFVAYTPMLVNLILLLFVTYAAIHYGLNA